MQTTFYCLTKSVDRFADAWEDGIVYPKPCPVCKRAKGHAIPPLSIRFEKFATAPIAQRPMKSKVISNLADFTWLSGEVFVTERVRKAFSEARLTGIEFLNLRARVAGDRAILPTKLWHLNVVGRARVAPECNVEVFERCDACGIVVYSTWDDGMQVDETTWDGSSFFRIEECSGPIVATEKIKQLVEQSSFTGTRFQKLEDYHDEFAWMRPKRL